MAKAKGSKKGTASDQVRFLEAASTILQKRIAELTQERDKLREALHQLTLAVDGHADDLEIARLALYEAEAGGIGNINSEATATLAKYTVEGIARELKQAHDEAIKLAKGESNG